MCFARDYFTKLVIFAARLLYVVILNISSLFRIGFNQAAKMDVDSDNVYMQNLQDYIFDESKIVTYKWLSNNLSIHINAAKLLIDKFLSEQKSKNSDVCFVKTFYVSGILKDDKGMVSTVVKEENLTSFKEKLQTVLSEHVYSIHKNTSSTDSNTLFLAGEHEDVCMGTIKNSSITKRTFDELAALRLGAYPKGLLGKTVTPNVAVNGNKNHIAKEPIPSKSFFKDPVIKKEPEKIKTENGAEKSSPVVPPNKQKQGKAGIAGFFSKQLTKPIAKVEKKVETVEPKKEKISPTKAPVSNGIKREISPEISPVKQEKSPLKADKKPAEKLKRASPPPKASNGSLKTYGKQSKGKKEPAKKRKRIQTLDSDSEEDNNIDSIFAPSSPEPVRSPLISDDDEDIIPPTPEVAKSSNRAPLNSRKRKKLIDKTFMDDDGYIVTKKEEVFESCSENEDEEIVKIKPVEVKTPKISPLSQSKKKDVRSESSSKKPSPEAKSKAKKKTSPKEGQGKQQSMMNFFKKV